MPQIRTMHTAAILEEASAFLSRCENGTQPPLASPAASPSPSAASQPAEAPSSSPEAREAAQRDLLRRWVGPGARRRPAVVFVGDLNSDLNDGIPGAAGSSDASRPHSCSSPVGGKLARW
jgi:hypothetical protein